MSSTAPKRLVSRKKIVAAVAALLVVSGGGVAYAYWSTTGSGSGTAAAATAGTVSVVQTSTVSNLRPGAAAQTLSGTFTNTSNSPLYVTSVTASIASVTRASNAPQGSTCDASDYTLSNATMAVGREIPVGTSQGSWGGATVAFNNKTDKNQDGCQGATVTFSYTAQ